MSICFNYLIFCSLQYFIGINTPVYLCLHNSRGKAGGYGIQGIASTFVTRIEGDGNNVIGLPLCRLSQELKTLLKSF